MAVEHWMTFATFSEQEFFTYPSPGTYHGVVLNANMVAHAPAGIAAFLLEKISPMATFLIDPMTHAFQHNPDTISNGDKGPKSSIKTLAGQYGEFIAQGLGNHPLASGAVIENISAFTRAVLNFQWDYLRSHFESNENAKYLEGEVIRRPSVLVAPYFYLTEDNLDEWLPVVVAAAREALLIRADYAETKLYSAVVIRRSILQDPALRERVAEAFNGVAIDGVLLWLDEFDEAAASAVELTGFANLCSRLRNSGLEVLNIHGGYFSCLLSSDAFGARLTGISHGPEFGEARGVVPVGGGIPISRYYVPNLHLRAKYREFLPIAVRKGWLASAEAFHGGVCDCQECLVVIAGNPDNFSLYGDSEVKNIKRKNGVVRIEFPTTEAKKRCLRHYLNCKEREFEQASVLGRNELLATLSNAMQQYAEIDSPYMYVHLNRWGRVLSEL